MPRWRAATRSRCSRAAGSPITGATAVTTLAGNRDPAIAPGPGGAGARRVGRGDRHQRLRAAHRARVGRVAGAARGALSLRVVDLGVHRREPAGLDETAPVGVLEDPATEEIGKHYGPLKAACERVVTEVFGDARAQRAAGPDRGPARSDRPVRLLGRALRASALARRPRGRRRSCRCPRRGRCSSSTRATSPRSCSSSSRRAPAARSTRRSPAGQWTFGTLVERCVAAGGSGRRRGRVDRRGGAARAQGRAVDGASAVDSLDVRRRGGLHGDSIARRRSAPGCARGRWRRRSPTPPRGSRSATMRARGRTC